MTHDPRSDTRRVLDSIRRIVRDLRVASRAAEADLGISAAQLFVLQRLADLERTTVGALAAKTFTDPSSVSVAVKRLAKAGLVARARSAEDERRVEITLTARGRALLKRAPDAPQDRLVAALAGLTPPKRRSLAALLEEVTREMGIGDDAAELFFEEGTRGGKKRKTDA